MSGLKTCGSGSGVMGGVARVALLLVMVPASWAQRAWADESTPASAPQAEAVAEISFEERLVDGEEERQLFIHMPSGLPMKRKFKLKGYVPADVGGVTATYWRSYDEGCGNEGLEPGQRLETKLRAPENGEVSKADGSQIVEIIVPEITQPWWHNCFSVKFWRATRSHPITSVQFGKIMDVVSQFARRGELTRDDFIQAAVDAKVFVDCGAIGTPAGQTTEGKQITSYDWEQRFACERMVKRNSEQLMTFASEVYRSSLDFKSEVEQLQKNAIELNVDFTTTIPSYGILSKLYGTRRLGNLSQENAREFAEDLKVRADSMAVEMENLRTLRIGGQPLALGSLPQEVQDAKTKPADFEKRVLGASPEERAALAKTFDEAEIRLVEQEVEARRKLLAAFSGELERRYYEAKAGVEDLNGHIGALDEQLKPASSLVEVRNLVLAQARDVYRNTLNGTVAKGANINVQQVVVNELKIRLEEARDATEPKQDVISSLQKQLAIEEKKLAEMRPEQINQELEQVVATLEPVLARLYEHLRQAQARLGAIQAERDGDIRKRTELGARRGECKLLLESLGRVEAKASSYEQAVERTSPAIRVVGASIPSTLGNSRGQKSARQVDRAAGFFTTDVGLGVMSGGRLFDAAPMTFIQVSMSFAHVDLDNGLGAVTPPAGTSGMDKLWWEVSQRFSVSLGLSLAAPELRTPDGQLTGMLNTRLLAVAGAGYRVTDFLKLNLGYAFGTSRSNLPGRNLELRAFPFAGLSLDLPVYRWVVRDFKSALPQGFVKLELPHANTGNEKSGSNP